MTNYNLSILIPARNEIFLARTIEDILKNIEGDTEVIAVMDGYWAEPPVPQHERVTVIHVPESIGQRAATNMACKLSKAKYVMKVDAHCAFDKGFDAKMLEAIAGHDDWTMAPLMRNLHAFDWVCPEGHRRYQSPSGPCRECGKETTRDVVWIAKESPKSFSYCFDPTPHFQYFGEFSKRPEGQGDITPSMSLQGSCFMMSRDRYWELNVCDESFGSWGSQGIEVSCKTWLSGGAVMVNKNTWYAHMFRTQGGDFSFPYPISGSDQKKAQDYARDMFFNNKWPKQKYPLSWLVEKFWPVRGWSDRDLAQLKASEAKSNKLFEKGLVYSAEALSKGMIYYSDCRLNEKIAGRVRGQLKKISEEKDIPIVSATLKKTDFGDKSIYFPSLSPGYPAMFKQIVAALEHSKSDVVFFCEHDVLYHPTHFDFTPLERDTFYYNQNVWFLRASDGHGLHYDVNQLSGLCGFREELLTHFRERLQRIEKEGFSRKMGFEPMTHGRIKWKNEYKLGTWKSQYPNIDIRHGGNVTGQRWKKEQFRDKKLLVNWQETDDEIPGWGKTRELIKGLK